MERVPDWWQMESIPFSVHLPTKIAFVRGKEFVHCMTELLEDDIANTIRLVASELISNAVTANERTGGRWIWISFETDGDQAILIVQDEGQCFDDQWQPFKPIKWLEKGPPDPMAKSGRGIFLCQNHCDELTYRRGASGVVVKAKWNGFKQASYPDCCCAMSQGGT